MSNTDNIPDEAVAEIIAAIESDDRSTLYSLLEQHGINCHLKRKWETGGEEDGFFEEPCYHECSGNAANIAVRFKNESLAVELLQRGIEVVGTYYSAESALGWSEESNTLFENAMYYGMPNLARELMSRNPSVDWGHENRHDCDGWSAGRWSNSLFLKVLQSTQAQAILQEAGMLAGTLAEHLVNISAENGQFRIRIGEEDLGLRPSLTEAMRFVADKVGYTLFDHEAAAEGYDGHVAASQEAMDADEDEPEAETVPAAGQITGPNYSEISDDIPF
jgi:hypothetical protein